MLTSPITYKAKACLQCGQNTPLEGFYNDKSKPDGKMCVCKKCHYPQKEAIWIEGSIDWSEDQRKNSDENGDDYVYYLENGAGNELHPNHENDEREKLNARREVWP